MAFYELKRRQRIRTAEGALELLSSFPEGWQPQRDHRDRLAHNALNVLHGLRTTERTRGHVEYLRGELYRVMECYQDAVLPLQRASLHDPENLRPYLALGWCYKRIGRFDLAIQALEDAMEFAAEDAIVHYNLACYHSLSGKKSLAIQFLSQAIELDPSYREMVASERDFDPIRDDPQLSNGAQRHRLTFTQ